MGMFDYIRCERPLPDGWDMTGDVVGLQTKDFNCEMCTHVITADGRLMLERVDSVDEVPVAERPYPNAEAGTLQALLGSLRFNRSLHHAADFHGRVSFGGLETVGYKPDERYGPRGRPIYKSHDYSAKFTDGKLVEIVYDNDGEAT